jgi:CO/xanthine dehydrogenase Mo-binding subunit
MSATDRPTPQRPTLGQSPTRTDGEAKVTGRACYLDDMVLPGMLFGKTIRSTVARGTLRGIRFLPGVPWDEFTVVTAKDVPGENAVHLIELDQPFLAAGEIRHVAEPVALIAHADKALVEKAARLVALDIDPLPAAFTYDEAAAQAARGEAQYGADNVFKHFHVARGDATAALARAEVVVRGTYETGAQEQLYIEPQGALAVASPAAGVTVWGSLQCPYYVHKALVPLFGLAPERVRIIQTVTGGGFGGKEEYPNLIAGHAALLAFKSGRPVKIVYDRLEDMWATTKRHPSRTTIAAGFTKDGKLTALDIGVELDGGAYVTLSPVVLSRGTLHAGGAYHCDDITIDSKAVFTNSPPYGAFRGFGAPQTIFAIEMHMERAARTLGIDPIELRRRNFLHKGDHLPTGQVLKDEPGLDGLVDDALAAAGWDAKRAAHVRTNAIAGAPRRGMGLSSFFHGSGFTGSGEVKLASRAALELTPDGRVRVLAASTDIGQGTNTVFGQIVADRLGVGLADVEIAVPDTKDVPDSGPTVASRTVMVVGGLLEAAATDLARALRDAGALPGEGGEAPGRDAVRAALFAHAQATGGARFERQYAPPPDVRWDDATYTGDAYATYAWSVQVAEVEVDPLTAQATVTDFVAVQEVGRVLHPTLAAGQIEGGVAQGIGWALTEAVVLKDGIMANHQLTNYIVPTAVDAPPIHVVFREHAYAHGPGGAKGIGELPMDGPAPAIGAALADALGVVLPVIPYLPERLLGVVEAGR